MTTPEELFDEMEDRCHYVMKMERDTSVGDDASAGVAIGAVIVADDGAGTLAVEFGLSASGQPQVTTRAFGRDGEALAPVVMELGGTVLISTDTGQM